MYNMNWKGCDNVASFSQRLRELRLEHKLTQNDLAKIINATRSTIAMYESGKRKPNLETIEWFADYFNVDLNYLLGKTNIRNSTSNLTGLSATQYDNIFNIKKQRIPLLGDIACGEPIFASEDRESYVEVGTDIRADFCLKAKDDSMINARILSGDIVFIRQQPMVENGEIAAVIIGDEATLKRVYYNQSEGKLILQAENPAYAPLVYIGTELDRVKILGKAIAFQSNVI